MKRDGAFFFSGYYLLVLLALYLPIGILFLFSVNDGVVFAFPLKGLTSHWYRDMLRNTELLQAALNSLKVALVSSLAATALGTTSAIALLRFQFRGKTPFIALALVPLLVPYIILGAALLVLFAILGIERSLWTVGVAHTIVGLPYALLVIMARMVGFDKHLEEAAQDLGASYAYTLRRVILPLIAPAILAAWLVAFTVSFDEFILASFLIGRQPTLPVYLLSQLRFANRFPQVIALTVLVMIASLSLVLLAQWLQRRGTTMREKDRPETMARMPGFDELEFQIDRTSKANGS
jgi:spermidine/putrescine transport system permease protein